MVGSSVAGIEIFVINSSRRPTNLFRMEALLFPKPHHQPNSIMFLTM